mgnify:CR=1 FL=1
MPLRKKNTKRNQIIFWTLVAVLIILMIVSFPATQHMTEVVLYP